jgi:hypothetical protein
MLRKGGSCREMPKIEGVAVSDCLDGQAPPGVAMIPPGAFVAPVTGAMAKRTVIKLQNRRENIVIVVVYTRRLLCDRLLISIRSKTILKKLIVDASIEIADML